jgi:hypothetical protein
MGFITKEDGTIIARQGDSGKVYIEGVDTNKNYKIYFGVRDDNGKPLGDEVWVYSNYGSEVVINVPANVSNMWEVPKKEEYIELNYGIKVCDEESGIEDTLILANCEFDTENKIVVYPKKVEGTLNG